MKEPLIPGGYILLSRKLIESRIMKKPPLYLKVWVWLLLQAQHSNYKGLKRGQWITSIPKIQEAMSYKVGYRTIKPTYKQIRDIIDWLRNPDEVTNEGVNEGQNKGNMIVTTKVTQGFIVDIVNYGVYQDPRNYEGHTEGQDEEPTKEIRRSKQGHNNNKNDINNNEQEDIYNSLFPEDEHQREEKVIIMTPEQEEYIKVLKTIKNYPLDLKKDIDYYNTLSERYPQLDLVEAIKKFASYKLDKPLAKNSNPRSQINDSFKNYVKWGKCLKEGSNGANKSSTGQATGTSEKKSRYSQFYQ